MFRSLAEDIVFTLIKHNIVDSSKRELYEYGAEVVLLNLSNILISLAISAITSTWIHFLVFMLIFVPLRIFCGGYHAKKSEICFVTSTAAYFLSALFYTAIPQLPAWTIGAVWLLWIFIVCISPVENRNNELDQKSRKRNRRISIGLISLDSIIFTILTIYHQKMAVSILIFIVLLSLLLFAGVLETQTERK